MPEPRITTQPFSRALEDLRAGRKLRRKAFDAGQFLTIEKNLDTDTFEIICHADGDAAEWIPTSADLLAEDWYETT